MTDGDCRTIKHELASLRLAAEGIRRNTDLVKSQKAEVLSALDNLECRLQSRESSAQEQGPIEFNIGQSLKSASFYWIKYKLCTTDNQFQSPVEHMDIIAQVTLLIGVVCNIVMGVSLRGGDFIINALSLLLFLAFQRPDGTLSSIHKNVIKQIPSTIEGAISRFNLSYQTTSYAMCTCHCTYAPTYRPGSAKPIYPKYCTNYLKPESQCHELLLEIRQNGECHPKKTFMYHSFSDYLASLLVRSDVKSMMDKACEDLFCSRSSPPMFIKNPFEASFLHKFDGPGPGKLFVDRGDEGRYAFALHVNFFNPEGMTVRGASTSSGIISMACLNLPLDVRYKPENMYLAGIIPGPKQPSLENLNHYIRPLVQELVASWERGVWYSKTANFPQGHLTRSTVALVVCDLPAA